METPGDAAVKLKSMIEICAQVIVQGIPASDVAPLVGIGEGPARAASRLAELWKEGKAASVVVTWVEEPGAKVRFRVNVVLGGGGLNGFSSPGDRKVSS